MEIMGLDLTDDSLQGTPKRVAKMYVKEIFSGLNPKNRPETKLFENKFQYNELLVEKDITFFSNCEHHFGFTFYPRKCSILSFKKGWHSLLYI